MWSARRFSARLTVMALEDGPQALIDGRERVCYPNKVTN